MNAAETRARGAIIDAMNCPGGMTVTEAVDVAARRLSREFVAGGGSLQLATGVTLMVERVGQEMLAEWVTGIIP